ncbi:glycosyltransferase involved in cell wall biosynthesis [Chitinophaga dinghuensis]|uniref:Glycosyltransferase involved in cell wall biosynthesis n=1 Tax=Chitinophaga dinghuensis TaxID=1539050 RepID=A0A327VTQ4_9BACT|nr:glycosyltransferase family 2 protein [Chitinophaga dinghuensis]RAJ77450.1 glycosyltransferase involved in cell wall biosynthesis [Chitinophaga dinghuensis]
MNGSFSTALLISTYNWPQALERIFLSLLKQSRYPDELLIADDGSREDTRQLIDRYRAMFPFPVKHAWHEDQGFRKSIILNKAIKLASADYIIEIDGDIVMHPHFIADHIRNAQSGHFVQGSRAILKEALTHSVIQNPGKSLHFLVPGLANRFNALRVPPLSFLIGAKPSGASKVRACNLAFWRKDFMAINGYNNLFEGWGWEDNEFAARLIHGGVRKKKLKLAAICFHLHHQLNSRQQYQENEAFYHQTIQARVVSCKNGYCQV